MTLSKQRKEGAGQVSTPLGWECRLWSRGLDTVPERSFDKRALPATNKPAAQDEGQTLPDATPPVGKIHPFSKIAVTFKPIQRFKCPSRFRMSIYFVL